MLQMLYIKIRPHQFTLLFISVLIATIFYSNIHCFSLGILNNCLLIAFFLGLKHGFDLDHIATIDNITNYLNHENIRAPYVGLYFSMGHSTSVFVLTFLTILFVHDLNFIQHIKALHSNKIDILISSSMLTLLGTLNLISFFKAKLIDQKSNTIGIKAKLISPLIKLIKKPWQTLFIGIIFGFGFDTATEIALLGITAFQAQNSHNSPWNLLILPINFSLGMCLIDLTVSLTLSKVLSAIRTQLYLKKLLTLAIILFAFFVAFLQITNL